MARYRLQINSKDSGNWIDTDTVFNTKKQLDSFIGEYNQEYEWRAGYHFKHFDCDFVTKFVWDTDRRKGEDVGL